MNDNTGVIPDRVQAILNNRCNADYDVGAAIRDLPKTELDALVNELLRLESERPDKPPDSN